MAELVSGKMETFSRLKLGGKRRIRLDTALRLARYLGMSADFWPGVQMNYDLDVAEDEMADRIRGESQVYGAR